MIGNDIVDLHFVDSPFYQHVDHLGRVCSPEEKQAVCTCKDPSRAFAAVWAAKEAAFKLWSRADANCHFVPRYFVTSFDGDLCLKTPDKLTVTWNGSHVSVGVFMTNEWVHAVASVARIRDVRWAVRALGERLRGEPRFQKESVAARRLASALLSNHCEMGASLRFKERHPIVTRGDGSSSNIGISLSHHGRFVAAAILCPPAKPQRHDEPLRYFPQCLASEEMCSTCTA